jgi:hypothetical protein
MLNRAIVVARAGLVLLILTLGLSGCGLLNQTSGAGPASSATQGAVLGPAVTAENIGDHNAPVNEARTFSASQDRIYVVAQAQQLDSGTTMFARWSRDGQPFEDSQEITANQSYQNTYIEFHLEPVNGNFDPGQYNVQIFVNGNPDTQAAFTVQ